MRYVDLLESLKKDIDEMRCEGGTSLKAWDIPNRLRFALMRWKIETIEQVALIYLKYGPDWFYVVSGVGKKSVALIEQKLFLRWSK